MTVCLKQEARTAWSLGSPLAFSLCISIETKTETSHGACLPEKRGLQHWTAQLFCSCCARAVPRSFARLTFNAARPYGTVYCLCACFVSLSSSSSSWLATCIHFGTCTELESETWGSKTHCLTDCALCTSVVSLFDFAFAVAAAARSDGYGLGRGSNGTIHRQPDWLMDRLGFSLLLRCPKCILFCSYPSTTTLIFRGHLAGFAKGDWRCIFTYLPIHFRPERQLLPAEKPLLGNLVDSFRRPRENRGRRKPMSSLPLLGQQTRKGGGRDVTAASWARDAEMGLSLLEDVEGDFGRQRVESMDLGLCLGRRRTGA